MKTLLLVTLLAADVGLAAELVVPETVVFERDIEYSNPDGQHLQLNLARPKNASAVLPTVLCIHGGGFRAGNRDGNNALCLKLAQRGFVAATVSYRLAPKTSRRLGYRATTSPSISMSSDTKPTSLSKSPG